MHCGDGYKEKVQRALILSVLILNSIQEPSGAETVVRDGRAVKSVIIYDFSDNFDCFNGGENE